MIYLHLFDPQINRISFPQGTPSTESYELIMRLICLSSYEELGFSSAHLFENGHLSDLVRGKLSPLIRGGHIVAIQSQVDFSDLFSAKQEQYCHVRNDGMYAPYYSNVPSEIIGLGVNIVNSRKESGDNIQPGVVREIRRIMDNLRPSIADERRSINTLCHLEEKILGRNKKALTVDLFDKSRVPISGGHTLYIDFIISALYTRQQLIKHSAYLYSGIPFGYSQFDNLNENRPLHDCRLLRTIYDALNLWQYVSKLSWDEIMEVREDSVFRMFIDSLRADILSNISNMYKYLKDLRKAVCLLGAPPGRSLSFSKNEFLDRIASLCERLRQIGFLMDSSPVSLLYERYSQNDIIGAQMPAENRMTVFVVYGRNRAIRDGMMGFLRALGLKPLEWEQACALTGHASPYIGDVIRKGMEESQATVVLLTGDDEARLKNDFLEQGESEEELTGQPRPNVIFEAGLAMGLNNNKTVLVQFGRLRDMSDILGRHVVRWDGGPEKRNALVTRLKSAGCIVDTSGTDWLNVHV